MKTTKLLMALTLLGSACDPEVIDHPETATDDDGQAAPDESFPSDVATAYCAALFACGGVAACDESSHPYADEPGCVAHEQARLEELRTNATAAGLVYDPACVDTIVASYSTLECRSLAQAIMQLPDATNAALGCAPYHGHVPIDDGTCITVAGTALGNCEAGARCQDDECSEALGPAVCSSMCGPDTTCTEHPFDYGPSCEAIAEAGESCFVGDQRVAYCAADASCQLEIVDGLVVGGTCLPRVPDGAACDSG